LEDSQNSQTATEFKKLDPDLNRLS